MGLARALFGDPAFVVLDEPNAALDAAGDEALMEALAGLKARGVTVVIISHRANVFRSADKLLYLKDGRADLFGPRDEVLAQLAKSATPSMPTATQKVQVQREPAPDAAAAGEAR